MWSGLVLICKGVDLGQNMGCRTMRIFPCQSFLLALVQRFDCVCGRKLSSLLYVIWNMDSGVLLIRGHLNVRLHVFVTIYMHFHNAYYGVYEKVVSGLLDVL